MQTAIFIHPSIVSGPKGPSTMVRGSKKLKLVHLRQSSMDEACGAHCVFMALIGLHIIRREDVEECPPQGMKRAVASVWRQAKARWFGGLLVGGVERLLKPIGRQIDVKSNRASGRKVVQFTLDQLARDRFVVLGIQNERVGMYHWVLAHGYSVRRQKSALLPERLYILDPNRAAWPMSQWNGEIHVRAINAKGRLRWWRDSEGVDLPVLVDGAIAIGLRSQANTSRRKLSARRR